MIAETVIGALLIGAMLVALVKWRRGRLYAELGARLERIVRDLPGFDLDLRRGRTAPAGTIFRRASGGAARVSAELERFRPCCASEAERLVSPERSFVPTHKKGGTVAYETLIASAPQIVSFYQAACDAAICVQRLVGMGVVPTPIYDQSSLSVLVYEKPGDHIGWHYDHNFYRGRHFTALFALDNRGHAESGPSYAALRRRAPERGEVSDQLRAPTL